VTAYYYWQWSQNNCIQFIAAGRTATMLAQHPARSFAPQHRTAHCVRSSRHVLRRAVEQATQAKDAQAQDANKLLYSGVRHFAAATPLSQEIMDAGG
jgi:hypothetical protein